MRKETMYIQDATILITGAAGFIGSNLALELLRSNSPVQIIGIDNMNDYYDVSIKEYRLEKIKSMSESRPDSTWTFIKGSIADRELVNEIFQKYEPSIVVNLAAQAGVRYSITNPDAYIESNLIGFTTSLRRAATHMIMGCRECSIWCMRLLPVFMDPI